MSVSRVRLTSRYGFDNDKRLLPPAYAESGGSISTFVADASANPNNIDENTYRVHKWTSVGIHSIKFNTPGHIDVLVIGGGGAGGRAYQGDVGAGGGAGGVVERYFHYVEAGTYSVFVAPGATNNSGDGGDSYFNDIIAFGGGGGGERTYRSARGGGSGGGSSGSGSSLGRGIPGQGFDGGYYLSNSWGAGGGGAGEPGGGQGTSKPGSGGDGKAIAFESNSSVYYGGGGVGGYRGNYTSPTPTGGLGGGANLGGSPAGNWAGGNANFYGGGGGGATRNTNNAGNHDGGDGYQGLVMIRYRINVS